MHKGPHVRFSSYTPQNTLREKILQDCANTEFKEFDVRYPHRMKKVVLTIISCRPIDPTRRPNPKFRALKLTNMCTLIRESHNEATQHCHLKR